MPHMSEKARQAFFDLRLHRVARHGAKDRKSPGDNGYEQTLHLRDHHKKADHDHHPDFPHGAFTMREE